MAARRGIGDSDSARAERACDAMMEKVKIDIAALAYGGTPATR